MLILLITGGNELPQTKPVKIVYEIFSEIRPVTVVTRAENRFVFEHVRIVLQVTTYLFLNILVSCVKLIVFSVFRGLKILVMGHKP